MPGNAQHIRIGLFTALALVLVAIVLIVFGGMRFWEKSDHYRIEFASSVIGLDPGATVYMNGIKVGTVETVAVAPHDISKVAVGIQVKRGTPVHTDTRAMLQYSGITGLKVIDLRDGTVATAALPPGSQIPAGTGLIDKLQDQAQQIVDQSAELMKRATVLTDNLIAVTDPARAAASNLAAMSSSLNEMVNENRAALRQSVVAIRQSATSASELLDGQVAQMFVNAGDLVSELRKLMTTNAGPLRAALFDLREATRNFKELARDVRQRPSRLLFSNAPSERKLP